MIVADTHVIIWDALKPERLSLRARKTITDANNGNGIIFSNKDPADRIIAATAIVNDLALVTYDKTMRRSKKVKTIW